MSEISNEAVAWIIEGLDSGRCLTEDENFAIFCAERGKPVTHLAALSAQPVQGEAEPVAKALEWTETLTQRSDEDPTLEVTGFETTTLFGTSYQIETGAAWFTVIYDYGILAECQTEQEAKAAAQTDFEQRVQSCLAVPQPKQPAPAQDGELERYIAKCEELANGGEYTWWLRLAEILRSKQAPTVAVPDGHPVLKGAILQSDEVGISAPKPEPIARLSVAELRARAEQRETPSVVVGEGWLDVSSAPKDSTIVKLLVKPGEGEGDGWTPFADSMEPYATIGFNALANTGEDEWQFAGWDWSHDCFTEGHGTVIGWAPFAAAPTSDER